MATLEVDIVSAEGHIHQGIATMVVAPAEMGDVGIAPRHAPLLTRLRPGEVRVTTESGERLHFFVGGGILEVQPFMVTVLADSALRAEHADEAAALRAKQDAEEKLAGAQGEIDMKKAQQEVIEAAARLDFVQRIKSATRGS